MRPRSLASSLLLSSCIALPGPSAAKETGPPISVEEVKVGELTFRARVAGPADGELVLLLHGFPETSYGFRHQIERLARRGFRAVAPDQRGYSPGARPADVDAYRMSALVGDVLGIADALGRLRFHLVGHDWGGAVAWQVALRRPERLFSLSVLSTPHPRAFGRALADPDSEQSKRSSYFAEFAADDAEERFLADDCRELHRILDTPGITARDRDLYLRDLCSREALRGALNWYRALLRARSVPATRRPSATGSPAPLTVPTLYLWGDRDGAFGREAVEATAEFVAGPFEFHVVEGVGHWLAEDAAETVDALLTIHLERYSEALRERAQPSDASYRHARWILDRAVAAAGGAAAAERVASIDARFSGFEAAHGQSPAPEPPWAEVPVEGRFVLGPEAVYFEQQIHNVGGTDRSFRRVVGAGGGWNLWIARNLLTRLSAGDVAFLRGQDKLYPPRLLPQLLLRDAGRALATLRWLGREESARGSGDRIAFVAADGGLVTLAVDARSARVAAVETLTSDPLLGDAVARVDLVGEQRVERVPLPERIEFRVGSELRGRWDLHDVRFDGARKEAIFEPPAGIAFTDFPRAFEPRRLADGVWVLRVYSGPANTYNTLIVELDNGVAVIDAPLVDAISAAVRTVAARLVPGKPLRYVVATHAHFDHIGGVRAHLASGVTVVAPPRTAALVRRMAAAPRTLGSAGPSGPLEAPSVEEFAGETTLGDGARKIRLIDVGPNPHADEIVVAYLPAEKILFVADLFALPDNGGPLPPSAAARAFSRRLAELGMDIETVVPAHGLVGDRQALERNLGAGERVSR